MTDFDTRLPHLNTHFLTKRGLLISYSIITLGLTAERLVCYCHTCMTTWGFVFFAPCSKHGEEEAFNAAYTISPCEGNPHLPADRVGNTQAMERTLRPVGLTPQPWPSQPQQQGRVLLTLPQVVVPHMHLQRQGPP